MVYIKVVGKSMFKPSFGLKKGESEFYQAIENNKILGEIELKPGNPLEIMSIYSNYDNRGIGRFLVNETKKNFNSDIIVRSTTESLPFWIKMEFKEKSSLNLIYKK